MKVNAINLKWDDVKGEGVVKTLSYFDTAHWVTKLDLLQDCIHDLETLYDEILLEDKNTLQVPVKTFSDGEPNYVTMPETAEKPTDSEAQNPASCINRSDIIRMAREAGANRSSNPDKWDILEISDRSLERFANLVAAHFECLPGREPQRQWVGLTKEEAKEISLANRPYVIDMIAALEARLKEKNT